MYANSNGPYWTTTNDKRITPFGKILRFTHLDEIPQLINIINGDLSFIGPRPERIELAEKYRQFPHYEIRHIIKPGLTGWAQINYRASASLEEAFEKLRYDIYYVKNHSIFLDIMIILKTIRYLFTAYDK
jgi:lipopolysaccharide/colanic/teichoic acid biosynthesis glycosyltransferase